MAKKLVVPKAGTDPASTPLHNMTHNSDVAPKSKKKKKVENMRTTILVNPTTYRRFKAYTSETGQTVTALINDFMEDTLVKVGR